MSYKYLKEQYGWLKLWQDAISSGIVSNSSSVKAHMDSIKREIRTITRNHHKDWLSVPITSAWRTFSDDEGETGKDFRIIPDNGQTDEEIENFIFQEVGYPPICSPYDCTGKRFTIWTHFARTRSGIVLIHCWGLDI